MGAMSDLHLPLEQLPDSVNQLYLAFSGGLDSSVLLHQLQPWRDRYVLSLWHINHGIQSNAAEMEAFARQQAAYYQLPIRVDHLALNSGQSNLEALARERRYQLFAQAMNAESALLTAHHMNDQAETLLLNLMRGSGPAGLSAIAVCRSLGQGLLFRPLLLSTREQIADYAAEHQVQWFDDPSNQDIGFDRNYLRHEILPKLVERWPAAVAQLHRVSEIQQESELLQADLATLDLQTVTSDRPFTEDGCLDIDKLRQLSPARQKNLVRYWLKSKGLQAPGFQSLHQLLSQLHSRKDSLPLIEGEGFQLRVYQQHVYIHRPCVSEPGAAVYPVPEQGELVIAAIDFRQTRRQLLQYLDLADHGQQLSLHFRQPGVNPPPGQAHRLKRLFQKHKVPPWIRGLVPQIYVDGTLVDLWLF